jgi:DNA polymerase-1
MKLLIDGDTLTYRAAFSNDGQTVTGVCEKLDELMSNILNVTNPYATEHDYQVFLTGKGNFRNDLTETYKANRSGKEKPILLPLARQYLIDSYNATVSEGEEADDAIAIEATRLHPNCVIVSVDKDFRQIAGTIYNPGKDTWETVTEEAARLNFYEQVLTGDRVDNIIGVHKVGPKTAQKMLANCKTDEEMFKVCVAAYEGDVDRVIMNARLLWLRRYEGELWEPPCDYEKD